MEQRRMEDHDNAQRSLLEYCKPVEFYNALQQRKPRFLKRNLSYVIEGSRERRTKLTVRLAAGQELPHSAFVCFKTAEDRRLEALTITKTRLLSPREALTFHLPEIRKLKKQLSKKEQYLVFILVADSRQKTLDTYCGAVFWYKLPMTSICRRWDENLSLMNQGGCFKNLTVHQPYDVLMSHGILEQLKLPGGGQCTKLTRISSQGNNVPLLKLETSGEEYGRSHHRDYEKRRTGKVLFYYLYHFNTLLKIEVTTDNSCPVCLARCYSFKGLQCHLDATHDRFHFEYAATDDGLQAVIVSCKSVMFGFQDKEQYQSDPDRQRYFYHRSLRDKKLDLPLQVIGKTGTSKYMRVPVHVLESDEDAPEPAKETSRRNLEVPSISRVERTLLGSVHRGSSAVASLARGGSLIRATAEPSQRLRRCSFPSPAEKTTEGRNRTSIFDRQFFHARTGQPMTRKSMLSEQDSEDEMDDSTVTWEDRRLLDDFVDVTNDEKDITHRWNTFVRHNKVLADSHVPQASVAFAKMHAKDFHHSHALRRCFLMMLIKFWTHQLINPETMDQCLGIVDSWPDPYENIDVQQYDKRDQITGALPPA